MLKQLSFRTFQTRIPGTLNSKYVNENRKDAVVRVEQKQPVDSTGELTLDVAREFMFYLNSLSKEQLNKRNNYRYNKNPMEWSSQLVEGVDKLDNDDCNGKPLRGAVRYLQ